MGFIKNVQPAPSKTATNGQVQTRQIVDPAAEAGLTKVDYYQTDKWVIGKTDVKTYIVPKNTLPEPLSKAFMRAARPDSVTNKLDYNDTKFVLDEIIDDDCDRVAISLRNPARGIADVEFDKDTFVVRIFDMPKSGVFSFNKEEFLKAVDAAKCSLEMYVLSSSDSDPEKP